MLFHFLLQFLPKLGREYTCVLIPVSRRRKCTLCRPRSPREGKRNETCFLLRRIRQRSVRASCCGWIIFIFINGLAYHMCVSAHSHTYFRIYVYIHISTLNVFAQYSFGYSRFAIVERTSPTSDHANIYIYPMHISILLIRPQGGGVSLGSDAKAFW